MRRIGMGPDGWAIYEPKSWAKPARGHWRSRAAMELLERRVHCSANAGGAATTDSTAATDLSIQLFADVGRRSPDEMTDEGHTTVDGNLAHLREQDVAHFGFRITDTRTGVSAAATNVQ